MNLLKKIPSFLIFLFFSLFLISITLSPSESKKNFDFSTQTWTIIWISKFSDSNKFIPATSIEELWFYQDKVDEFDDIYITLSNSWFYQKYNKNWYVSVKTDLWLFLYKIRDLNKNYNINNKTFEIKPKSIWRFFVDSRDSSNIKIFSLDSILEVSLLDSSNKKSTQIILYPHMWFSFNSNRNSLVKNADLLRIESIFQVWYYKDTFYSANPASFINSFYKSTDTFVLWFFNKLKQIDQNTKDFDKVEDFIVKSDYSIPWLNYINKYFVIFLNNSKKSVYYQNNIIVNLNNLATDTNKDAILSQVQTIKSDLENLKSINQEWYNDSLELIIYYYKSLLNTKEIDLVTNTFYLSELIRDLKYPNISQRNSKSSFLINKLYSILDQNDEKVNLENNIIDYIEFFFEENNIKFDNNSKSLSINTKKNITSDFESLSYFIKNVILQASDFSNKDSFSTNIEILKYYFYINQSLNILIPSKEESLVIEYSNIVDKLLSEIRNNFFLEELDTDWLLVLNQSNLLERDDLSNLNEVINWFFTFHNSYKSKISTKNMIYNKFFEDYKIKYDEYYLALANYNNYSIKYNKTKNDLFNTKTILESWNNEIVLDDNYLKTFLSKFVWLDSSNISVKVIDNNYFEIKNLFISWESFSFNLYPKEGNRIDKIFRSWQELKVSYELDSLELDMKELFKSANEDDKDKYDYKRFFLNTFFNNNNPVRGNYISDDNDDNQEDRALAIFKRDKLVWDKWEFSILKWFLDILYDDVKVWLVWNNYDININGSKFSIQNTTISWQAILWIFNSDYVFSDKDHYFENINVVLYTWKYEDSPAFFDSTINISWKIDIVDFKTKFSEIINAIFETKWIFDNIYQVLWISNTNISYNNWTILYSFDNNWREVKISARNQSIVSITVSWNNILNNKIINYTDLTKYLELIK